MIAGRSLVRPGDWLVLALALTAVGSSIPRLWQSGFAEKAIIRQNGEIFREVDLGTPRDIAVDGPLGQTLIRIETGRARVVADPGPRQYCVKQGWLMRPGEVALCAPNRVSLQITGRTRRYDSLSY